MFIPDFMNAHNMFVDVYVRAVINCLLPLLNSIILFRYRISGTLFPVPYGIILLMQEKIMGMVTKTGISWLLI